MAQESTLYKVITRLQELATSHKLVNEVRTGFMDDIDLDYELNGVEIYIIPQDATYPRENVIQYNVIIHAMDSLLPDKSNLLYVVSDCQSILNDIYVAMQYEQDGAWALTSGSYRFYKDKLKDLMAGAELTFGILSYNSPCSTNLPLN